MHLHSIRALTQWTKRTNFTAMKTVNVHEAKTHFSSLLNKLETDSETIVICRNGEPVADLVPHQRRSRIRTHPVLGKIKIGYDPVKPLSHDEWPETAR
jgi:prevent-host-death family protein